MWIFDFIPTQNGPVQRAHAHRFARLTFGREDAFAGDF
jgi:hypothetical protein